MKSFPERACLLSPQVCSWPLATRRFYFLLVLVCKPWVMDYFYFCTTLGELSNLEALLLFLFLFSFVAVTSKYVKYHAGDQEKKYCVVFVSRTRKTQTLFKSQSTMGFSRH